MNTMGIDLIDEVEFLPLVLVVDGNEASTGILSTLLGSEFRLKFAKNGEEALTLANGAEVPDLILLDTVLSDMSGYEVSRQLNEVSATRDIPIILVSVEDDPMDQVRAFESGAVDYLTKPFNLTTMECICSHVVAKGRQRTSPMEGQVRDEERKRISREIHDELGQLLSALRMQISGIKTQKEGVERLPNDQLTFMSTLIERAQTATKDIVSGLRSPVFGLDIVSALKWQVDEFIKNANMPCELHVSDDVINLKYGHTLSLVRIAQEALTNVMRYAEASWVEVKLLYLEDHLILVVRDNGVGFDVEEINADKQSFGLAGIQERAEMLGGLVKVTSKSGYGTVLNAIIPV